MVKVIKLKNGLNILLKGKAATELAKPELPAKFAVKPTDFKGIRPKMLVRADDSVKEGTPLFFDKFNPDVVFTSPVSGLAVEFVFAQIRGHEVNEGFLVTRMLIPLVMPVDVPLWMVSIATVFAVIIGKETFGGTGMNLLNPALKARAFLFFAYPIYMSGDDVWITGLMNGEGVVDGFSGATPLANTAIGDLEAVPRSLGIFLGFIPGSIGETSTVAVLLGALILWITGVGSMRIMASVFVGGLVMGLILNISAVSTLLKPYQDLNIEMARKLDILRSIEKAEEVAVADNRNAYIDEEYDKYIVDSYVINHLGEIQEEIDAFGVRVREENRKTLEERNLPVFVVRDEDMEYYIIPVYGRGLWGPVFGYIALEDDFNTIFGVIFDHEGETPGLGAEISTAAFENQFKGKRIFNEAGEFVSIDVIKSGTVPMNEHRVDGVSGGTITGRGVDEMLRDTLGAYVEYFRKQKNQES